MELVIMYLVAIAAVRHCGLYAREENGHQDFPVPHRHCADVHRIADGQGHLIHRLRFQWCHLA